MTQGNVRGEVDCMLCEWRSWSLDSLRQHFVGIPAQIKTTRRKVASTKQFIKASNSEGGRAGYWVSLV